MFAVEQAHIEEEIDIIRKVMKEYGKALYTNRLSDSRYYDTEAVETTVNSVRKAGPELAKLAREMQRLWSRQKEEVPTEEEQ